MRRMRPLGLVMRPRERLCPSRRYHQSRGPASRGGRRRGYPERFAQEALGHNSKAVHRAYARKAQVVIPTLEDYERKLAAAESVIVPMPAAVA
jgi:hypothetical protein